MLCWCILFCLNCIIVVVNVHHTNSTPSWSVTVQSNNLNIGHGVDESTDGLRRSHQHPSETCCALLAGITKLDFRLRRQYQHACPGSSHAYFSMSGRREPTADACGHPRHMFSLLDSKRLAFEDSASSLMLEESFST